MTADLPSDEDIAAMMRGASTGIWCCWAYPVEGSKRIVKAWSRNPETPPLDRRIDPVGCIVLDMGP